VLGAGWQPALLFDGGVRVAEPGAGGLTFSAPAPQPLNGTLRLIQDAPGRASITAQGLGPQTVYFDVWHAGSNPLLAEVSLGGDGSPPDLCEGVTFFPLPDPEASTLRCTVPSSPLRTHLPFSVTVAGQTAAGTDLFSYPSVQTVSAVSGCVAAAGAPGATAGRRLPDHGRRDADRARLAVRRLLTPTVAGLLCPIAQLVDETELRCVLPPGSGVNQPVVVSKVFNSVQVRSDSAKLLSFAAHAGRLPVRRRRVAAGPWPALRVRGAGLRGRHRVRQRDLGRLGSATSTPPAARCRRAIRRTRRCRCCSWAAA
jgi:hypothetical protein